MICENLVQNVSAEIFLQKFYPHLVRLSSDKVPNIRFIVARIFVQQLSNNGNFFLTPFFSLSPFPILLTFEGFFFKKRFIYRSKGGT